MLDIKLIKKDPERVKKGLSSRQKSYDMEIDEILRLDAERRDLIFKNDQLKAKQNQVSKMIPVYKKEGKDISEIMQEMKVISETVKADDEKIKELLSDIGIDTNIHGESLSDNTAEIFLNSENAENILMSELQTLMSKSKDDSINNLDDAKKSSKIIDRISSAITAKFFEGLVEKGVNEKLNNEIFLNNSENLFDMIEYKEYYLLQKDVLEVT